MKQCAPFLFLLCYAVSTSCLGQKVVIENIGEPVNTEGAEYVPLISLDESILIYTYRGVRSIGGKQNNYAEKNSEGDYFEDIMISKKGRNNKWTSPRLIGSNVNTNRHEAAMALSADGQKMFLYKDTKGSSGDIYISYLSGKVWSPPLKLLNLNSKHWEGTGSISADNKIFYFASERPGGYGGKDIYYSTKLPGGLYNWSQPKNLGPIINTSYDDHAPFIFADGKTLFFSSEGHHAKNNFDIFKSVFEQGVWSKPENLGAPINTKKDDLFFVVSASGEHGYMASDRKSGLGKHDIYKISFSSDFLQSNLTLISGIVTNSQDSLPTQATIQIVDLDKDQGTSKIYYGSYRIRKRKGTVPQEMPVLLINLKGEVVRETKTDENGSFIFNDLPASEYFMVKLKEPNPELELFLSEVRDDVIAEYHSNSHTGKFVFPLPVGKNYGISISKDNFLFHSVNIDLRNESGYSERKLEVRMEKIEAGKKVGLGNIFFEKNSDKLSLMSKPELERIVRLMQGSPNLRIKVTGHTDDVGSDEYNLILSEKRARSVIDYLVTLGVSENRMSHVGLGESYPIASNDTEEGRKANRRIDLEIIAN